MKENRVVGKRAFKYRKQGRYSQQSTCYEYIRAGGVMNGEWTVGDLTRCSLP